MGARTSVTLGVVLLALAAGCSAGDGAETIGTVALDLEVVGQQKLVAPDPGFEDRFGNAVAISGETALVGSMDDDDHQGSAFVFARTGAAWRAPEKLVAPQRQPWGAFGSSVAIDGSVAVVGAAGVDATALDQGAAYVFRRLGTAWTLSQTLVESDVQQSGEHLGTAVALSSSWLAIGGRRSVRLYARSGAQWLETQTLSAPSPATGFGFSLALSENTLITGAAEPSPTGAVGAAYVYVLQGTQWLLQQRLVPTASHDFDDFGGSVALSGETAVVGASEEASGGYGAAYVFTRSGSVWTEQQALTVADRVQGDQFGHAVALLGSVALIGAPFHDHAGSAEDQGAAYLFRGSAGNWAPVAELRADDGNGHDFLGRAVSLSVDTALLGSPNDDNPFQAQGSAYAFSLLGAGGVFDCARVAPDGDDDAAQAANGATPFRTVQAAIDFAARYAEITISVCVAVGPTCDASTTYPGDLTMHDGISVLGGYESNAWTRCAVTRPTLVPSTGAGVVFGPEIVHPTTLNRFEIVPALAPVTAAVSVRGAAGVELSDITVPERPWPGGEQPYSSHGFLIDAASDVRIEGGDVAVAAGSQATIGVSAVGARVAVEGLRLRVSGPPSGMDVRVLGVELADTTHVVLAHSSIHVTGEGAGAVLGISASGNLPALILDGNELVVTGFAARGLVLDSELSSGTSVNANVIHVVSEDDVVGVQLTGGGGVVTSNTVTCEGHGAGAGTNRAVGIECAARNLEQGIVGCTLVADNIVDPLQVPDSCLSSCTYEAVGLDVTGIQTVVDANQVSAGCGAGRNNAVAVGMLADAGVRIQNNVIEGSRCPFRYAPSVGLWAAPGTGATLDVHSNAIFGGHSSGGVTVGIVLSRAGVLLRNNIIDPGYSEQSFNVNQRGPELSPSSIENNDFVPARGRPFNLYRIEGAPDARTIQQVNALPGARGNLSAPCGYPLQSGTACIDAGTPTGAPGHDIDGDARDDGAPDVGPDELGGAEACTPIGVDTGARTVQTERFFLDFSNLNPGDPEELNVLRWAGQATVTLSAGQGACFAGDVEYFGNSWAPPDPQAGGRVLVGAGSAGTWQAAGANAVVIDSRTSSCPPASADVPVRTRYTFRGGIGQDTIEVERTFEFGSTPFNMPFRPYVPRLIFNDFPRVIHPDATGTALREGGGTDWDGSWFAVTAIGGAFAGQGVIVKRAPSAFAVSLWLDDDGFSNSNATSALLLPPAGGFAGSVRERELLCFFDATSWPPSAQASLTLPPGCTFDLSCDGGSSGGTGGAGGTAGTGGGGSGGGAGTAGDGGTGASSGSGAGGTLGTGGSANGGSAGSSGTGGTDACHPNPCLRGAACLPLDEGYACDCPSGTYGTNCKAAFTELAAALRSACGLREDGHVRCWGEDRGLYSLLPPDEVFQSIGLSEQFGCGLTAGGTLSCWGTLLGGSGSWSPPPGKFSSFSIESQYLCAVRDDAAIVCAGYDEQGRAVPPAGAFKAVGTGALHACAIRTDGTLACWGYNYFGQASPPAGTFAEVVGGGYFSCGRRTDGTISCWGSVQAAPSGTFQKLYAGNAGACALRSDGSPVCWGDVYAPAGTFKSLALGYYSGCALRTDDTVTCWGDTMEPPGRAYKTFVNGCGIRGDGSFGCVESRLSVPGPLDSLTFGAGYGCGIQSDESLACFPNPSTGDLDPRSGILSPPAGAFTAVSAGWYHACALRTDGTLTCWGRVTAAPSGTFIAVASAATGSCALRTDHTAVCFGDWMFGAPSGAFSALAKGNAHACGLRPDGTLTCWGWDVNGQTEPPSGRFDAVSAYENATCALRSDDKSLLCWGYPDELKPPSGPFAGMSRSCGLRADRTVVCWGYYVRDLPPALEGVCDVDLCGDHGACTPRYFGPTCTCDAGYAHAFGDVASCVPGRCLWDYDQCDELAGCRDGEDAMTCGPCPSGFTTSVDPTTGVQTCTQTLSPCDPNPCQHDAACIQPPSDPPVCVCPAGTSGTYCER